MLSEFAQQALTIEHVIQVTEGKGVSLLDAPGGLSHNRVLLSLENTMPTRSLCHFYSIRSIRMQRGLSRAPYGVIRTSYEVFVLRIHVYMHGQRVELTDIYHYI